MKSLKALVFAVAAMVVSTLGNPAMAADPENTLYLDLNWGRVVIAMRPDLAPKHVERIKELTRKGFYDGTVFHRVIAGFMAQGGDPTGTGMGGSGVKLQSEFSGEHFTRGKVGMARSSNPHSGDSQFFIMLGTSSHLDGKYTLWGEVIEGMEHVDKITKIDPQSGAGTPDTLVRMRVAADVKE